MLKEIRDIIRLNPTITRITYQLKNWYCSYAGRLIGLSSKNTPPANRVALCLRFRDEARYLAEWIEYYRAAGISHFFLYNNNSVDHYEAILTPYVEEGLVTLIEWPRAPASPSAEEDCISRAIGNYDWVGFVDTDEFVVVKSGRSIPEFLSDFSNFPGVALHWYFFGSNYQKVRPSKPVIEAYIRRRRTPDVHVKVFVRPNEVTQCNNPHSWFFRRAGVAVDECRSPVWGSRSTLLHATEAWINHYYTKSEEDYIEKSGQKGTQDVLAMRSPSRTAHSMHHHLTDNNEVVCFCAQEYYKARLLALRHG